MPSSVSALAWIYLTSYDIPYARVLDKGERIVGGGYELEFNPGGGYKQSWVIWNGTTAQDTFSRSIIPLNTLYIYCWNF